MTSQLPMGQREIRESVINALIDPDVEIQDVLFRRDVISCEGRSCPSGVLHIEITLRDIKRVDVARRLREIIPEDELWVDVSEIQAIIRELDPEGNK